ncbi:Conserved hypothetical protein CHP00268 [Spirochaeta thermophila DSM 6578]|uniref:NAD/GMP synthase domain-containing protein n=2 Tax=Winmispira thermophila TaxID=154 RepID=G0GDP6_WINT7|nr:Conserved hypothetical protein CHP00268 [Spirochaeta thermophila DSM 6578]
MGVYDFRGEMLMNQGADMDLSLIEKEEDRLVEVLKGYGRIAVGFSGGVDSTFLAVVAREVLGKDAVRAYTLLPPHVARWEAAEAAELARRFDLPHRLIEVPFVEEVRENPPDRCYRCKRILFGAIKRMAEEDGYPVVCDGTNASDPEEDRPGMRALRELGVRSPLREAGLTKERIRDLSRAFGLPTWDKPPYSCLITRIPHGVRVDEALFRRIEEAELLFLRAGFRQVRVRHHGDLARIELGSDDLERFLSSGDRDGIVARCKELGYRYVTLDLEGYRTGSMSVKEGTCGSA